MARANVTRNCWNVGTYAPLTLDSALDTREFYRAVKMKIATAFCENFFGKSICVKRDAPRQELVR